MNLSMIVLVLIGTIVNLRDIVTVAVSPTAKTTTKASQSNINNPRVACPTGYVGDLCQIGLNIYQILEWWTSFKMNVHYKILLSIKNAERLLLRRTSKFMVDQWPRRTAGLHRSSSSSTIKERSIFQISTSTPYSQQAPCVVELWLMSIRCLLLHIVSSNRSKWTTGF